MKIRLELPAGMEYIVLRDGEIFEVDTAPVPGGRPGDAKFVLTPVDKTIHWRGALDVVVVDDLEPKGPPS